MIKKMYSFFDKLYLKKIDATGLGVFRIFYSIILFAEVSQLFYFRHLIFDKVPYLKPYEIDFTAPIILWLVTIFFLITGLFTRTATILNYVFSLVFLGTISSYEYHMDYMYLSTNFLMIFIPVSKVLSLDRLFLKLKYSNTRQTYKPDRKVSQLYYFAFLFFGVGIVYFDSIFHKLASSLWLNGLGVWLPSSYPQTTFLDLTWFLNQKWLMYVMSWLTIALEVSFIFIFWRKKFRIPLVVLGVALHLGIIVSFPIPWFGLAMVSYYILLIPVSFFKRKPKKVVSKLKVFYDLECPLCVRTKIAVNHFNSSKSVNFLGVQGYAQDYEQLKDIPEDILLNDIHSIDKKGNVYKGVDTYIKIFKSIWWLLPVGYLISFPPIYFIAKKVYATVAKNRNVERCNEGNCGYTPPNFPKDNGEVKMLKNLTVAQFKVFLITLSFAVLMVFQFFSTLKAPLINKIAKNNLPESVYNIYSLVTSASIKVSKNLFGISPHGVFVQSHFSGYNHVIAVKHNGEFLPLINEDGQISYYNTGRIWAKYSFRTNSPLVELDKLNNSLKSFTAFWAAKHNLSLEDLRFEIVVKKVESTNRWQKDFLNNQIKNNWIDGGYILWKDQKFESYIKDIEKL